MFLNDTIWRCLYRKEGWNNANSVKDNNMNEQQKPEEVVAILKNPIRTGMSLALGFFLMSIILTVIGYFILGASCAAVLSQMR